MDEIHLQHIPDPLRGALFVGTEREEIPFPIKRFYFITDIPDRTVVRGGHAHKVAEQILFCLRGSCLVRFDDGKKKWEVRLSRPGEGVHIRPRVWHDFTDFSSDALVLVVASTPYDKDEYIHDPLPSS